MSETTDLLRAKFDELSAKRAAILNVSGPLREQRDKIKNETRERVEAFKAQIKDVETGLPEIDSDLSRLAKALGGRRMSESTA